MDACQIFSLVVVAVALTIIVALFSPKLAVLGLFCVICLLCVCLLNGQTPGITQLPNGFTKVTNEDGSWYCYKKTPKPIKPHLSQEERWAVMEQEWAQERQETERQARIENARRENDRIREWQEFLRKWDDEVRIMKIAKQMNNGWRLAK